MSEHVSEAKSVELSPPRASVADREILRGARRALGSLRRRPVLWALALSSSLVACDGGGSRPQNDEPDAADAGGGAGGASPSKEGGAGGHVVTPTTDGGGVHDGGMKPAADVTPPTFDGVSKIETLNEGSVRVSWAPAVDDVTPSSEISYRVYRASKKGGEDFTRTRRCGGYVPDASTTEQADLPCYITAVAGSTSAVVSDAVAGQSFYYVAHAVDAAGNEDSNTNEASAETKDETPPIFGGVDSIAALTATSVRIEWGAAFDSTSPDPELTYEVFLSKDQAPDPDKDKPAYTSKPGEHTAIIDDLTPLTTYHVIVRATDPAGNTDTNTYSLAVTTPEGVPPTFSGVKRASADGATVRLFWLPGSDNVTHPENIVYDIYSSLQQHREDFNKPPRATSDPGAASIVLTEANLATKYYYVVRARDVAGNEDANFVETSAQTGPLPDTTPPVFNGAQTVVASSPTSLTVSWNSAADETSTQPEDFTYVVYVSQTTPVSTATPALTVRGALSGTLIGLTPATTYNVVVVAKDAAGNPSSAQAATSGKTADAIAGDTQPPTLTGTPTAAPSAKTSTELDVAWTAATDDVSAATDIRYHLCVSQTKSDCTGSNFSAHVALTTGYGVVKGSATFLDPRTTYFVFVRAEDKAGNVTTDDTHFVQGTTATSWSVNVEPVLFNHCISCHDYNTTTNMINVLSSYVQGMNEAPACAVPPANLQYCQLKLIDPTRPQYSLIYRRVNPLGLTTPPFSAALPNQYSGAREPRDTHTTLTAEEDGILLDWISQGALTF